MIELRECFLLIYLIADQGINHLPGIQSFLAFFTCDRNRKTPRNTLMRINPKKNPIFLHETITECCYWKVAGTVKKQNI